MKKNWSKKGNENEYESGLRESGVKEYNSSQDLLKNKRTRITSSLNYSKNDEEKMMKYALKLSEIEYKNSLKNSSKIGDPSDHKVKTYKDIPLTPTFEAQDYDFLDFSKYVDICWSMQSKDTGIFKIKPPQKWIDNSRKGYSTIVDDALKQDPNKKYMFKIQKLNELHKAQVRLNYIFIRNSSKQGK